MTTRNAFDPAFLPSAGLNERRATLHVFDHSEGITLKNEEGNPTCGVAHYYRCTETGAVRRWGFDAISADRGN